ncbi:hypothetical protein PFICI_01625 [Pestalotiopsis fici W106-1]|uniref:Heterokaryon incompatibility domain-containing protein n=1 Tax=Pestalotiopsis fici (strain W106-1 / CGMCC3.15140) TaxID=1229662 RepID=W3XQK6_PESFW|nr:uncharacterized protein PFICI_01625 [Pestalotiopsis fici W106-1]ETS87797.1 hypothetical protein PFICI_01625 [Pestalotiopsis fici W106-1]
MEIPSKFCDICQYIKLEDYLYTDEHHSTVRLGRFQDIAKRTQCPLCCLAIKAFNVHARTFWKTDVYPVEVCYLGRYHEQSNKRGLQLWFDSTTDTYPEGISGYTTTVAEIVPLFQIQALAHTAGKAGKSHHARLLGEMADIALIRDWMRQCALSHGSKCNPPKPHPTELPGLRLLLVDVLGMKLVESAWESRYMALSYVWGWTKSLRCTKANINDLRQDGSLQELRDEMPRAISDAICLTKAVGERYLWVDALCIIQDDDDSKRVYISRMDQIYSNACVTLVTLTPKHAESALPGITHPRNLVQTPVEINDSYLVQRLPHLSDVVQDSSWNSRAWTFQEGILSRRCLYFAEHQVFWQCRTSYQSEDHPDNHEIDSPTLEGGWMAHTFGQETGDDPSAQFRLYRSLTKSYCHRYLTFPSDALNAFSGILSSLTHMLDWKFACALPESLFDFALLWKPQLQKSRARWSSDERRESSCTLPTWCWTAWKNQIWWDPWRLDSFAGQDVTVKTEVGSFWIRDSSGIRQIRRIQGPDQDTEMGSLISIEQMMPPYSICFEAKTISLEAYAISEPRLQQSAVWRNGEAGGGLSPFYRRTVAGSIWIYDIAGQHCGTIHKYDIDSEMKLHNNSHRHDLVMLSRSTQAQVTAATIQDYKHRLPPEYPSDREYYEEIFDTRHYCYKNDWAINIMLVRWEDGLAQRVSVGQIHVDAWNESIHKSIMITLV